MNDKLVKQLQELLKMKDDLVDNLNTKGVVASKDETLETLVPKVLAILQVQGDLTLGTKEITQDGDYFPANDGIDAYSSVSVNIMGDNDAKVKYGELSGVFRFLNITSYGDLPSYAWNQNSRVRNVVLKNCEGIGSHAFNSDNNLISFTNDKPIKAIGEYAFNGCSAMVADLNLSDDIETIPTYCFNNCSKVQVNLPKNLKIVEPYAFYMCTNLYANKLPDGLESIGINGFRGCSNLEIDELPQSLKIINNYGFYNCTKLTAKVLPPMQVNGYAFSYTNVAFEEIPEGTSLAPYAFQYANGLTNLKFSYTGRITNYCFQYCTGLESIELGKGITSIDTNAFRGCNNLKTITCHRTTPPTLTYNAINSCPIETIYVPASALETYKSATNWSAYADKMIEIEGE